MEEFSADRYYSGFKLDYTNKTFEIMFEDSDKSLMEIWAEEFKSFTDVNVCLSGGIDSQFLVYLMGCLKKQIKIYIFSWVWEDCVFNSPDVLHAIRFCERHNLSYTNIEIDYKKFISATQLLETCRKYKTDSPQIALQLKMLDLIDNDNPIFLGADTPIMQYDFKNNKASIAGINYQFFSTGAFLNYANINKKIIIKDVFKMTPETQFQSYKHFLNTTKKYKMIYPFTGEESAISIQPIKKLMYDELGAKEFIIEPLLKNTGFEILKMHLAKKTGIYNQYDLLYRAPIKSSLKAEDWYEGLKQFKVKIRHPAMKSFVQEYEKFCQDTEGLNKIDIYNFIL